MTASRVEAVFDVAASEALDQAQRERLAARAGSPITAVAQDARSQSRNRELALKRLAGKIGAGLVVPRRRRPTRPTRASKERRLQGKKQTGERKATRRRPGTED